MVMWIVWGTVGVAVLAYCGRGLTTYRLLLRLEAVRGEPSLTWWRKLVGLAVWLCCWPILLPTLDAMLRVERNRKLWNIRVERNRKLWNIRPERLRRFKYRGTDFGDAGDQQQERTNDE